MNYFKQKIYEISGVPKTSLEKIEEASLTRDEILLEYRFEKFIKCFIRYLIKTKNNKNI